MRGFFARLARAAAALVGRFLRNQPKNAYEAVAFRAVSEAATVFSRRVIVS